MSKKSNYVERLKESIMTTYADLPKTVDSKGKGPMIDPILGYDGSGEMETTKDIASILERYYFREQNEPEELPHEGIADSEPDSIPEEKHDIETELEQEEPADEDEEKEDKENEEKENEENTASSAIRLCP